MKKTIITLVVILSILLFYKFNRKEGFQSNQPVVTSETQGVTVPVVTSETQGVTVPVVTSETQGVTVPVVISETQGFEDSLSKKSCVDEDQMCNLGHEPYSKLRLNGINPETGNIFTDKEKDDLEQMYENKCKSFEDHTIRHC